MIVPAPLYKDPIFDGAADPMVIRKDENGKYDMVYTQRRAMQQVEGVSYCYGSAVPFWDGDILFLPIIDKIYPIC